MSKGKPGPSWRGTPREQFESFDQSNPQVYSKIVEIASFMKQNAKKDKYGIGAIWERLRWISDFETDGDQFKLNNNFRAFYARKLMSEHPEFLGFFEIRASIADQEQAA